MEILKAWNVYSAGYPNRGIEEVATSKCGGVIPKAEMKSAYARDRGERILRKRSY